MTEPRPIVLIGAARSGTKFLRDVLASGRGTAAVPYDINYVWRYGVEDTFDDVLDPATLTEKRKAFIRKSARSLAKASPEDILIEKTVANTLRVPFVDAVFPEARYVHLIRDGREVAESAMRQWKAPPDWSSLVRKVWDIPPQNLGYVTWFGWNFVSGLFSGRKGGKIWGPRFPGIEEMATRGSLAEICAKQWLESFRRANADLQSLPDAESRVFTIRYEDLVRDDATLSELLHKLELPDKDSIIFSFKKKLRPNESQLWRRLPEEDLQVFERVLASTLKEIGYA